MTSTAMRIADDFSVSCLDEIFGGQQARAWLGLI